MPPRVQHMASTVRRIALVSGAGLSSCATSCPAHGQHRSSHCPRFRCWTFYLLTREVLNPSRFCITLSLHFVLSHGCTYAVPVRSLYSFSSSIRTLYSVLLNPYSVLCTFTLLFLSLSHSFFFSFLFFRKRITNEHLLDQACFRFFCFGGVHL